MVLSVSALNGVKVYNLSAGKTLPQWLDQTKSGNARALRYNDEFRQRLELVQGLDFPTASTNIKVSRDGSFLAACGVYKPQVKVFELSQLSEKFERHLDADIVDFDILSDDYSKLVFLRSDRTVEFHARWGHLHTVRIPKFGRRLAYHGSSCDLLVCGSSSEIYRLNLEQGQFVAGFQTQMDEVNALSINPRHGLVAAGGKHGTVECWDNRDQSRVAALSIVDSLATSDLQLSSKIDGSDVSALAFGPDGLSLAVGSSTGHVLMYDLRSSRPLLVKDHRYGRAIADLKFHERSGKVLSTDSKLIKIWDRVTGEALTSIQPSCTIHRLCLVPNSGLVMAAGEQQRVPAFYIPELGPAPKWCAFLDNLTEELEEQDGASVFDDYQFVTRDELTRIGLSHLIGSSVLRPYMHGFFMDIRLWKKVKAVADPFEYDTYVRQRVQQKIAAQRSERITVNNKLPKVNRKYAEALLEAPQGQEELQRAQGLAHTDIDAASAAVSDAARNPLGDQRFSRMFDNPDFEIDANADEYERLRHSNAKLVRAVSTDNGETSYITDFQMEDESDRSSDSDSDDVRKKLTKKRRKKNKTTKAVAKEAATEIDREELYVTRKQSLAERVQALSSTSSLDGGAVGKAADVRSVAPGSRAMEFVPRHTNDDAVDDNILTADAAHATCSRGRARKPRR